jgi:hypothetical protein
VNAPLKISKNDAGLAHALGRAQQRSEAELQSDRLKGALQNTNRLKSSLNAFGDNVVFSHIEKPYGKRQRWAVAGAVQFSHGILLMMNGNWRGDLPIPAAQSTPRGKKPSGQTKARRTKA